MEIVASERVIACISPKGSIEISATGIIAHFSRSLFTYVGSKCGTSLPVRQKHDFQQLPKMDTI